MLGQMGIGRVEIALRIQEYDVHVRTCPAGLEAERRG
jgi:hypothetical protein